MQWGLGFFFLPVFPLLTHMTSVSIVCSEGRGGEPWPVLHEKSEARGPGASLVAGTRGRAGEPAPVTLMGLSTAVTAPARAGEQRELPPSARLERAPSFHAESSVCLEM